MHENQAYPPSLSNYGSLRFGKKSDILSCLEECADRPDREPESDAIVVDGAAVVNALKPRGCKIFEEYAVSIFIPFVQRLLQNVKRVDIVWATYLKNSLKANTRNK